MSAHDGKGMATAAAAPFDIPVLLITGTSITLRVYPMDTVNDIKEKINDKEGIPVHLQRLSLARESLPPLPLCGFAGRFTLAAMNIVEGTILLLWRDCSAVEPTAISPPRSLPPSQLGPRLHPSALCYTHMPNSDRFRDGRSIATAVMELIIDPTKVMPIMKVVDFAGVLWCRSNRRFLAYRAAAIDWLREGLHFEVADVDRHFITGLSLTNLEFVLARDRDSPLDVDPRLWRQILACHAAERARESHRLARAHP